MTSPTAACSPFFFNTWVTTPFTGAGNSTVTLSVSIMTTGSSCLTGWPASLSQSPTSTSVIDSPTAGTRSSMLILVLLGTRQRHLERAVQQPVLFEIVARVRAGRGARGLRPRYAEQWQAARKLLP